MNWKIRSVGAHGWQSAAGERPPRECNRAAAATAAGDNDDHRCERNTGEEGIFPGPETWIIDAGQLMALQTKGKPFRPILKPANCKPKIRAEPLQPQKRSAVAAKYMRNKSRFGRITVCA
ncbi:unnamed protein product [Gongylonema pulchrum]|uniref:Uncharacterized protein n=1 Tax=Gongylonema pulchrum TaxID=637853 RepID=A0A183EI93_9BILA|nr:unnamed protein product [Gongylonema pulchrum]